MDSFCVPTSGSSIKKTFGQIHYLDYLPHLQENISTDSTSSYEDCVKLFEESLIHFGQENYIDAEDTLIRAIVLSYQKDESRYKRLCYKAAFLLVRCGVHLGSIPIIQSYLDFFVSLRKPVDLKVNEGELMETLNKSPVWTLRRHAVLSLFHESGLCSQITENDIRAYGFAGEFKKACIASDPVETLSFCLDMLGMGENIMAFVSPEKSKVPLSLECVRISLHVGQLAAKDDIFLPNTMKNSEENRLLFKCLILLADHRRVEAILSTGKEPEYNDSEIVMLLMRSSHFSNAKTEWKKSLLSVLHRYNRCLDVGLEFCDSMEEMDKAQTLFGRRKYQEAVKLYTSVTRRSWNVIPKLALSNIYVQRGECYLCLRDYNAAVTDFHRTLEQYPEMSRARVLLQQVRKATMGDSPQMISVPNENASSEGTSHYVLHMQASHALSFEILNHLPYLQHNQKDMPKPGEERVSLLDLIKKGAELFASGDYLEAEDKLDNAVALCEIIKGKIDITDIHSKAAIWLMKSRIMVGNLDILKFYVMYFISLMQKSVSRLTPVVMKDFMDTINESCLSTIRRHSCLEILHTGDLCTDQGCDQIKKHHVQAPYPLVSKDPKFVAGLCQQLLQEGLNDLTKMKVADALEKLRTTIAYAEVINEDNAQSIYLGPRSTVRFMEYKCLFLLADFRSIHSVLRDNLSLLWDDEHIFQFLDASKAPEHRKKAVLVVLNKFNRCICLTDKDLSDITLSVSAANAMFKAGNYVGALTFYKAALDRAGTSYSKQELSRIYYNRGSTYLSMGMRAEAENDLKKSLEVNPSNEKAERKLKTLVAESASMTPDDSPESAVAKANRVYKQGDHHLAVEMYTKVLARLEQKKDHYPTKDLAIIYYNRGSVLQLVNEKAKARNDFQAALRLNPEHKKAKDKLQSMGGTFGDIVERNAEKTVAIGTAENIGEGYCDKTTVSSESLPQAENLTPLQTEMDRAKGLIQQGNLEEALGVYQSLLRKPNTPPKDLVDIHFQLGSVQVRLAKRDYQRSLELDPQYEKASTRLRLLNTEGEQ